MTMTLSPEYALAQAGRAAVADVTLNPEGGDSLIVLNTGCPPIPGEQGDDGVRAVAAIDILRHLVALYEEPGESWCLVDQVGDMWALNDEGFMEPVYLVGSHVGINNTGASLTLEDAEHAAHLAEPHLDFTASDRPVRK